jgi:phytanoyl-CoA hydroxylase
MCRIHRSLTVAVTNNDKHNLPTFAAPHGGRLTDTMLVSYREAGVIIFENFVSLTECRALQDRALELAGASDLSPGRSVFSTSREEQLDDSYFIESGDKIRVFFEPEAIDENGVIRRAREDTLNKMGHAMHDLDPVFEQFSRKPELAEIASGIGMRAPVIIQSMYIFKPPRIGGEVAWHQDSTYLFTEPESCVGFWFALEDATVENGCMYFIPGAHKQPLKKLNRRISDRQLATDILDDSPWPEDRKVAVEAKAGTLVVFDGRSPHFSGPNRSEKSRHAYTLHAIDSECEYPAENWLQRDSSLPLRGFI